MKKSASVLVFALTLGLSGCANPVTNAATDALVCAESARILTSMQEVLDLAGGNPLALPTYTERAKELHAEFDALEPRGEELSAAHQALSDQILAVITTAEEPNLDTLVALPEAIANLELAAMDYLEACTP